jgi:hypothetical protein
MTTKINNYRAMYLDSNTGDWLPATSKTTHDAAEREVARLTKSGINAMVESVQTTARLAARKSASRREHESV